MADPVDAAFVLNGEPVTAAVEGRELLVTAVRERYGLTAVNVGCDTSSCGACTVLLDGAAVKSCTVLTGQATGHEIETFEGLHDDTAEALRAAFSARHALQCGFCTPGMITAAVSLLRENPEPTEHEVRDAIEGNLCRCTGYHAIVQAILDVAGSVPDGTEEGTA